MPVVGLTALVGAALIGLLVLGGLVWGVLVLSMFLTAVRDRMTDEEDRYYSRNVDK